MLFGPHCARVAGAAMVLASTPSDMFNGTCKVKLATAIVAFG
jgi:hypothetical protein